MDGNMSFLSEWIKCGYCDHCGRSILMRPSKSKSKSKIVLAGAEQMEFIHEDGTTECKVVSVSKARPYSDIGKFKEYMKVMSKNV